ncbi:hypothetical protein NJBCHELONAE_05920 [Mycobacteroides chelonae]|uniref:alpha/beta hydrolase n=1 Tax=Mycobacteroides chelonae TaxID=1774 RepID=UPI0021DED715|nr:alpha/beta hydrolase [Mycobacteroides chelonae]GLE55281.1 hypothetical protein NJBCHELONAE_05920 [Mycobacteroides chelonae]
MTITIPGWLEPFAYLASGGMEFPDGDEDAMQRLADSWRKGADQLVELFPELNRTREEVKNSIMGMSAEAIDKTFKEWFEGDLAFDKLAGAMDGLAQLSDNHAMALQYTKLIIITSMAIAAVEILWALAWAVATFGASLGAIPVIEALTIAAIRKFFTELLKQIVEHLAKAMTKTAIKQAVKKFGQGVATQQVRNQVAKQVGKRIAIGVAIDSGLGIGQEAGVQAFQILDGTRKELDGRQLAATSAASVAGAVVGAGTGLGASRLLGGGRTLQGTVGRAAISGFAAGSAGAAAGMVATAPFYGGKVDFSVAAVLTGGGMGGITGAAHGVGGHFEGMRAPVGAPETTPGTGTPGQNANLGTQSTQHGSTSVTEGNSHTQNGQTSATALQSNPATPGQSTPPAASSTPSPTTPATTGTRSTSAAGPTSTTPPTTPANTPSSASSSSGTSSSGTHPPGTPAARVSDSAASPAARAEAGGQQIRAESGPVDTSTAKDSEGQRNNHGSENDRIGRSPDNPDASPRPADDPDGEKNSSRDRSDSDRADVPDRDKTGKEDGHHPRPDEQLRTPEKVAEDLANLRTDPDDGDTGAVNEKARSVRDELAELSREERSALIANETQEGRQTTLGDLDGFTGRERDVLNRHNHVEDMVRLHPNEADVIRDFARKMDEHLADPGNKPMPDRDRLPSTEMSKLQKVIENVWNPSRDTAFERNVHAVWNELYGGNLEQSRTIADPKTPVRQLYSYDPRAFNGDGRVVVSIGDLDKARAIAVNTPGITTTMRSLETNLNNAENLHLRARQENPDLATASLVWIGYNAPSGSPLHLGRQTVTARFAEAGGNRLAHDVAGLAGSRTDNPEIHLFGHSYGSSTTAYAGTGGRLGPYVSSVTLLGSPGAGPLTHASQFGSDGHNVKVYVASNSHDPVTWVGGTGDGTFNRITGKLGLFGNHLGLGMDPAMHEFGATRITAEYGDPKLSKGLGAHTNYYSSEDAGGLLRDNPHTRVTESLDNFSHILSGNPDRVNLEIVHRDPDVPFTDISKYRDAEPATGYPGPNECGRQNIEGFRERHPESPVQQIDREHGGAGITRSEYEAALRTTLRDGTTQDILNAVNRGELVVVVDTYGVDHVTQGQPGSHTYTVEPNADNPARPLVYDGAGEPYPWPPAGLDRVQSTQIATFDTNGRPLHPPTDPVNTTSGRPEHISGKLGLPDYPEGSLSNRETRTTYLTGEQNMHAINDDLVSQGTEPEPRARVMSELRNEIRGWARELMANQDAAAGLNRTDANLTYENLMAKYQAKGLSGDDIHRAIAEASTRSRPGVNRDLGIDPRNPGLVPPPDTHDRIGRSAVEPKDGFQYPETNEIPNVGQDNPLHIKNLDAGEEIPHVDKMNEPETRYPRIDEIPDSGRRNVQENDYPNLDQDPQGQNGLRGMPPEIDHTQITETDLNRPADIRTDNPADIAQTRPAEVDLNRPADFQGDRAAEFGTDQAHQLAGLNDDASETVVDGTKRHRAESDDSSEATLTSSGNEANNPVPQVPRVTVPESEAPRNYAQADVDEALRNAPRNDAGEPIDHRNGRPLRLEDVDGHRGWVMRWDPNRNEWIPENRSLEPDGLPMTGEPNSLGYDADGNLMPYANHRPPYDANQVEDVWNQSRDEQIARIANGRLPLPMPGENQMWVQMHGDAPIPDSGTTHNGYRLITWEPGMPRDGLWDMGHVPGAEYRALRRRYLSGEIDLDEFLTEYQDPENYRVEDPSRNRSHTDENLHDDE